MQTKQASPRTDNDLTLEALRRAARDAGDGLVLSWLDALAKGERARSSSSLMTQSRTNHGPTDAAG
jgi:hypothetical protein